MDYLTKKGTMMQNQNNFSVFVSYSTKDVETIKPIVQQMQSIPGLTVFFADRSLNPGDFISQRIIQNIKAADLFIVYYSEAASKSTYVQQEIGVARGNNKIILPILLDQTKPSAMLNDVHYLDLHDESKREIELGRLFQFLNQSIQCKNQRQLAQFLALLGIGYLLFKGESSDEADYY
ncbi:TIR domain protein [anaerobic digester metagenome]